MKNITALAAAGLLAASSVLAGCSPTTEQAYTGPPVPPPTVWTGSPAPATASEGGHGGGGHGGEASGGPGTGEAHQAGANLHQYIVDNKIGEAPFTKDQPGTPKIDFPLPEGWSPAGARKPDWAYGAIVYDKAPDPTDPPFLYAIASKLTGNVDPEKILELAPSQLNELPGFKAIREPRRLKFSGYDSVDLAGTYEWEGESRSVGQQTVLIPGKDGLFVLQLNGEAPKGQAQIVIDAADVIRDQTKIVPAS